MFAGKLRQFFWGGVCILLVAGVAWAQAASGKPVAIIGGQAIHEEQLLSLLGPQLRRLRQQEYEAKKNILEGLINQKLVETEAARKGLSADQLLAHEVDSKIPDPAEAEVEAYYLAQRDRLNRPLEQIEGQLRQNLKQARIQKARQEYFKRLRDSAEVTILLRPPRTEVGYDTARLLGDPKAPVTIVEFSDFQCQYCQRAQAPLKEVLAKYAGRVKLAFRDYPLHQIHPQAQVAAEAARCAADQGKFWPYHDLLFANFGKLDKADLLAHASALALDEKLFQECVESGKYKAAVDADLREGTEAGVSGTPAFFVNGILLSGAQPASAFESIIDQELADIGHKDLRP